MKQAAVAREGQDTYARFKKGQRKMNTRGATKCCCADTKGKSARKVSEGYKQNIYAWRYRVVCGRHARGEMRTQGCGRGEAKQIRGTTPSGDRHARKELKEELRTPGCEATPCKQCIVVNRNEHNKKREMLLLFFASVCDGTSTRLPK